MRLATKFRAKGPKCPVRDACVGAVVEPPAPGAHVEGRPPSIGAFLDDLLQSHTARTVLANSEFIIMLNQASTDRLKPAELLNISDLQIQSIAGFRWMVICLMSEKCASTLS